MLVTHRNAHTRTPSTRQKPPTLGSGAETEGKRTMEYKLTSINITLLTVTIETFFLYRGTPSAITRFEPIQIIALDCYDFSYCNNRFIGFIYKMFPLFSQTRFSA